MALFEQRVSDEQVALARVQDRGRRVARSAAAAIPCAPSTLSLRIKKQREAEADAQELAVGRAPQRRRHQRSGPLKTSTPRSRRPNPTGSATAPPASRPPERLPRCVRTRSSATEPEPATITIDDDLPPGAAPVSTAPGQTRQTRRTRSPSRSPTPSREPAGIPLRARRRRGGAALGSGRPRPSQA